MIYVAVLFAVPGQRLHVQLCCSMALVPHRAPFRGVECISNVPGLGHRCELDVPGCTSRMLEAAPLRPPQAACELCVVLLVTLPLSGMNPLHA